jgi:glutamate carboxypeptidase
MESLSGVLDFCESQRGWMRQLLETLVRLESPSHDRAAVNRCGDEIARQLQLANGRVTRLPGRSRGDHIRAEFGEGGRPTLLLGHFDTVWDVGQLERMPVREESGRLYGPGTFDMKAGIASALLALRALERRGLAPHVLESVGLAPQVVVLFTADEEVGSGTSRRLIEAEARASQAVLVLEPSLPGGAAKTSRKGSGEFELLVQGVAAHAGLEPGKGASAIHELARQILQVETLADPSRGVTVNVGLIGGGSRPNVVAAEARATVDVRVSTAADAARVEAAFRGLRPQTPRTGLEVRGGVDRPPLERTHGVVRLYRMAKEVAASLGRDLAEGAAGGGSDGNFTAAVGVPTLDGLGPEGDGAHAPHEHVVLTDIPFRAALLAGLLGRLAEH